MLLFPAFAFSDNYEEYKQQRDIEETAKKLVEFEKYDEKQNAARYECEHGGYCADKHKSENSLDDAGVTYFVLIVLSALGAFRLCLLWSKSNPDRNLIVGRSAKGTDEKRDAATF
jgi:hypothetical protein